MNRISSLVAGFPRRSLLAVFPTRLLQLALVLALALTGSTARGDPQGQNVLILGTGAGASGTDVVVPLSLVNQDAVGGIQLDIRFDPEVVSFTSGAIDAARATGMTLSSSVPSSGRLRVLMYFGAGGSITAGTGDVADLTFHLVGEGGTSSDLTPADPELSDPNAQVLQVTTTAGRITVTGGGDPTGACCAAAGTCAVTTQAACTAGTWQGASTTCTPNPCSAPGTETLSIGTASGASGAVVAVPLSLRNTDAVGGIQLDILFDPAVASFAGGAITARATGMSLGSSVPATGRLRVVMYYSTRDSIVAGSGAVANLTFNLLGGGGTGTDLNPERVYLSDPDAHALSVTATAGHLAVTGGGDPTGACCAPAGTCALTTQTACASPNTWRGAGTTCAPNPCPAAQPADTLSAGGGTGPSGGQITIPISLANRVAVRGIQADIRMDPAVLRFMSGSTAQRAGTMVFAASSPSSNLARIVMYFDDGTSTIAPGRGPVANLVFGVIGAAGAQSSITPSDIHAADANNHEIPTVGQAGQVTVVGGAAPPDLHLAVLKNPGRNHTLQIFLTSDVLLDATPTVTAGTTDVPMTPLPGVNIYQGNVSLADGIASVTVQASGAHGGQTGATHTTVTF
jgi:hypothetical protein